MLIEAIGAVIRAGLFVVAGWLVEHGVWTKDQANQYVVSLSTALAIMIVTLAWTIFQKYKSRLKLNVALAIAGIPENEAHQIVKDPGIDNPPVSVPKHVVPQMDELPTPARETQEARGLLEEPASQPTTAKRSGRAPRKPRPAPSPDKD